MNIKISSNRSFGIVFSIVFLLVAIWPILNEGQLRIWSIVLSAIFISLGLVNSKLLTPLNIIWFKFGIFLGKIVSPLIMAIIFFFFVTLIALIMKIFKKDLLNLKFNKNSTYWIEKKNIKSKMKNQF